MMSDRPDNQLAPEISIVMPLYNKGSQVLASIASVLAQSAQSWELVVVDDGSTDNGPALVAGVHDSRIRLFRQANAGVSVARNRGVELARTNLIAFLDADDLWHEEFLAATLALARDFPAAQWFATGYEIRHPREGVFKARVYGLPKGFQRGVMPAYFDVAICSDSPVWTSAAAVRRNALQAIGGFPHGIASGEDLLTWARLAARFPLAYDIRCLAVYEVSDIDRQADSELRVTLSLAKLANEFPAARGLRAYLGRWCRIEAVIALRFDDPALARQLAWMAVRHGPRQLRNLYTLLLTLIPQAGRQALDTRMRSLLSKKKDNPAS